MMQTAADPTLPETAKQGARQPANRDCTIVVVGAGPVGIRVVYELKRQNPGCRIELFGNEPWKPYNRVKLSSFLAGEIAQEALEEHLELPEDPMIHAHYNEAVTGIDRNTKAVVTRYGGIFHYCYLVIATGSEPFIPGIPGVGLQGVYTFRDMTDTYRLFARKTRSRHTLIIGGGLLGLECAKAMRRFNTRVTVIEQSNHLMFHQLDSRGSKILQIHVEGLGIKVITNDSVCQILGTIAVQAVELRSGRTLKCDTVILATGITPNIELAKDAGLMTNRGILVNDDLQTSDPSIFAVGECAEHRGEIYALVAPGYEQAAVAASVVSGKPAIYRGSISVSSLKVVGIPLFSLGDIKGRGNWREELAFIDSAGGIYRKLIFDRKRLVGVIALGQWREIPRLREMLKNRRRIRLWQRWRFRRTGLLWRHEQSESYLKTVME